MPTEIKSARDALEKILWCLNWMSENTVDQPTKDHLAKPIELAKAALALPRLNCEVGTAEEQNKRLCSDYFSIRRFGHSFTRTALEWAQMPYEAEKGGEE